MITQTIGLIELLWTLMIVIGLCATIFQFKQVLGDLRALKRSKRNGILLMQVRNDIRTEALRISCLVALLWFSYLALTAKNVPTPYTWKIIVTTAVFIWIPLAITYNAVSSTATRQRILAALEEREKNTTH